MRQRAAARTPGRRVQSVAVRTRAHRGHRSRIAGAVVAAGLAAACGSTDDPGPDAGPDGPCAAIGDSASVVVARAASAEDHALRVTAQSESATLWSEDGNDALVLDVTGNGGRLIGHLVMHQGAVAFEYAMHVGALARGEAIALRISTLSEAAGKVIICLLYTSDAA